MRDHPNNDNTINIIENKEDKVVKINKNDIDKELDILPLVYSAQLVAYYYARDSKSEINNSISISIKETETKEMRITIILLIIKIINI